MNTVATIQQPSRVDVPAHQRKASSYRKIVWKREAEA